MGCCLLYLFIHLLLVTTKVSVCVYNVAHDFRFHAINELISAAVASIVCTLFMYMPEFWVAKWWWKALYQCFNYWCCNCTMMAKKMREKNKQRWVFSFLTLWRWWQVTNTNDLLAWTKKWTRKYSVRVPTKKKRSICEHMYAYVYSRRARMKSKKKITSRIQHA